MPRGRDLHSGCFLIFFSALAVAVIAAGVLALQIYEKSPSAELTTDTNIEKQSLAIEPATGETAAAQSGPAKIQDRMPAESSDRVKRTRGFVRTLKAGEKTPAIEQPPQGLPDWGAKIEQNVPGQNSLWSLRGSNVRLEVTGRGRRFYYVGLRRGLLAKDGDLAFDGVREGPTLTGLAFLFSENCAPIPYQVKGSVSADETTITLKGKLPRRDARCNVVSTADDEMVFKLEGKL